MTRADLQVFERLAVGERVDAVELAAGELLFDVGEPLAWLWIVEFGQVEIVGPQGMVRAGPGALIGQVELMTERPTRARAIARRDSWLRRIPVEHVRERAERDPALAMALARATAHASDDPSDESSPTLATTVALLASHPRVDLDGFARTLAGTIAPRALVVARAERPSFSALGSSEGRRRFAAWLAELAARPGLALILLPLDAEPSDWNRACAGSCDERVLVADGSSSPTPGPAERELGSIDRIALLHPAGTTRAPASAAWLAARTCASHHHLALGERRDHARLARFLIGRALGLVLSGGGARSFAHIGVIAALAELGIEIDAVAGASSGAAVGASLAAGHDIATIRDRMVFVMARKSPFGVPTLPLVSLRDSTRTAKVIEEACEGYTLEDLWLPFVAVSTNLSRGAVHLHRRGPLARALLASGSMPVIMPPVLEAGDVLCDGGLLDNLPVGPARTLGVAAVLASDVSRPPRLDVDPNLAALPLGFRGLIQRLGAAQRNERAPSLMDIAHTSVAAAIGLQRRLPGSEPELLLRPGVEGFALDAFSRHAELEAVGRAHALAREGELRELLARLQPP
ncbi:patatin-like phospholipase family protein [Nannocystaceae bacterium ST9]